MKPEFINRYKEFTPVEVKYFDFNPRILFIGDDGQSYESPGALHRANKDHFARNNFYIVHDAQLGRREIVPGTGKVQVCVGFELKWDPITSRRIEVPLFREEVF